MTQIIDFAWARPPISAIKNYGYSGVIRYLSHDPTKDIDSTEFQTYVKNGLSVTLVWEDAAMNALNGAKQGAQDSANANALADSIGWPNNRPIYFAVDFGVVANDMPKVLAYLKACAGRRPVGVYGSYYTIESAATAKVATYFWQTMGWSNGFVSSHTMLIQRVNGARIPSTDLNDIINPTPFSDWGQYPYNRPYPKPLPNPNPNPTSKEDTPVLVYHISDSTDVNVTNALYVTCGTSIRHITRAEYDAMGTAKVPLYVVGIPAADPFWSLTKIGS